MLAGRGVRRRRSTDATRRSAGGSSPIEASSRLDALGPIPDRRRRVLAPTASWRRPAPTRGRYLVSGLRRRARANDAGNGRSPSPAAPTSANVDIALPIARGHRRPRRRRVRRAAVARSRCSRRGVMRRQRLGLSGASMPPAVDRRSRPLSHLRSRARHLRGRPPTATVSRRSSTPPMARVYSAAFAPRDTEPFITTFHPSALSDGAAQPVRLGIAGCRPASTSRCCARAGSGVRDGGRLAGRAGRVSTVLTGRAPALVHDRPASRFGPTPDGRFADAARSNRVTTAFWSGRRVWGWSPSSVNGRTRVRRACRSASPAIATDLVDRHAAGDRHRRPGRVRRGAADRRRSRRCSIGLPAAPDGDVGCAPCEIAATIDDELAVLRQRRVRAAAGARRPSLPTRMGR